MLTFTQFLNEGRPFEWNGSVYSSGYNGIYSKDNKQISKEEYKKASDAYKEENKAVKKMKTIEVEVNGVSAKLDNAKKTTFYAEMRDGFEKNEGNAFEVSSLPGHKFVLVKNKATGGVYYNVSEVSTGLLCGDCEGANPKKALEDFLKNSAFAEGYIHKDRAEEFDGMVKAALARQSEEKKSGKEDADKVKEVIPTSKDYHISGGFPGGSQYAVKRQTMEVTYPRRKGMFADAHTDIKYNYNKDSKALYSFYKSDATRKNKELNKEDFIKYAIKTLSFNLDDKIKNYGDKNAKMDIEGIKSKVAEVFTSYINDNFEKISK